MVPWRTFNINGIFSFHKRFFKNKKFSFNNYSQKKVSWGAKKWLFYGIAVKKKHLGAILFFLKGSNLFVNRTIISFGQSYNDSVFYFTFYVYCNFLISAAGGANTFYS